MHIQHSNHHSTNCTHLIHVSRYFPTFTLSIPHMTHLRNTHIFNTCYTHCTTRTIHTYIYTRACTVMQQSTPLVVCSRESHWGCFGRTVSEQSGVSAPWSPPGQSQSQRALKKKRKIDKVRYMRKSAETNTCTVYKVSTSSSLHVPLSSYSVCNNLPIIN